MEHGAGQQTGEPRANELKAQISHDVASKVATNVDDFMVLPRIPETKRTSLKSSRPLSTRPMRLTSGKER